MTRKIDAEYIHVWEYFSEDIGSFRNVWGVVAPDAKHNITTTQYVRLDLYKKDDPEWDCTDYAHPAWWRGHDHGAASVCIAINKILDGGVINSETFQTWEKTKKRIEDLKNKVGE